MLLVFNVEFCQFTRETRPSVGFVKGREITIRDLIACDHEVTQGEYEKYCSYTSGQPSEKYGKGDNFPANYVNWYAAIVYCNLRSMDEDLTPVYSLNDETDPRKWNGIQEEEGKYRIQNIELNNIKMDEEADGYRLPTEAEWEYLARGGETDSTTYSGSDNINDVAWYDGNSNNKVHEVKQKAPNKLGLYDMSGNVWEWCWDYYYKVQKPVESLGSGKGRVQRGGAFKFLKNNAPYYEVSCCFINYPIFGIDDNGFRVVRTAK